MVDRRKRRGIQPKPQPKAEDVDALLNELGTDPESGQQQQSQPPAPTEPRKSVNTDLRNQVPTEASTPAGKYPHRISADVNEAQYKRLKWASFDSGQPLTKICREALEEWLKARGY